MKESIILQISACILWIQKQPNRKISIITVKQQINRFFIKLKQINLHIVMLRKKDFELKIVLFVVLLIQCESLFSKYYRKCRLFETRKGQQLSQLNEQRVVHYASDFYIEPLIQTSKPLQYRQIDYFYHQYIGAGGSGQVYLIQEMKTNQPKIFKRYFKQKQQYFQEQNFVMHKLNYSVQWTKDNLNGIPKQTNYEKDDQYVHTDIPTIAIYPYKQSLTLRDVEFFHRQASMIFYKILLQIKKVHQNSFIHNDLKMGNIVVNSLGNNFKFFQTQLIDWNLASFYYLGAQTNVKKGTACYYSPQQLMRATHITPAVDIWALGVVMWTFFTDDKPFYIDCRQNNLQAIASLVGIKKLIEIHQKYRFPMTFDYYEMISYHIKNPNKYPPIVKLRELIPSDREYVFTDSLMDVFERMLNPDPQQRITISQLLEHDYFKKIGRIPRMYKEKQREQQKKKNRKLGKK